MNSYIAKLLAPEGWNLEDGTSTNTTPHYGIVAREDTVIATWTDEDSTDLVALFGIGTKTLKVTDPPLIIPKSKKSINIKLTSGSVCLLRK